MWIYLNKPESPSPKDVLGQVWLKLAPSFWRRRFSNFINVFLLAISLYLSLEKGMALHLNKLKSITQGSFVSSLVEIGYSVLEKKIFKIHQCIFAISLLSTLGKGSGLFLIQTWIFFTQEWFVQSLLEIYPSVPEEKIFKFCQRNVYFLFHYYFLCMNVYLLFHYYLPLEKDVAIHLKKLESPSPKNALCQVWFILISSSVVERKIFKALMCINLLFRYNLSLEKEGGLGLHLNKFESPLQKDPLYQVWLKLAHLFWRRRFSNFVKVFSLFFLLSPLWKGLGPSFEQTWIPFTQRYFMPSLKLAKCFWRWRFLIVNAFSLFRYHLPLGKNTALHLNTPLPKDTFSFSKFVEIGPVVLEKKMKMWKGSRADGQTDGGYLIRKPHSVDLSDQVS